MGLKNLAQTFQRFISTVLDDLPNCFVYLDYLLLYDTNKHGLILNLKKCRFALSEVDYLGFRVNGEGITPLPRKLDAITSYPNQT